MLFSGSIVLHFARSFRHTTLFTDDPGELIDEEVPKNETDTEVDGCGQSQEWDHGIRPVVRIW